jgi:hypothetical protein
MIKFKAFMIIAFFFSHICLSQNIYQQSEYDENNKCGKNEQNKTTINDRFKLNKNLDQGETPTCYAHAAYYLIQYYINSIYEENAPTLSVTDVLIAGKNNDFKKIKEGSAIAPFLYNLKGKNISTNTNISIEDMLNKNMFKQYLNEGFKFRDPC